MDTGYDLLAVGPHPDDVEIGVGGTLAVHVQAGFKVAVLDLTAGELASNGTPAERRCEAGRAAQRLGVQLRLNARLPDGALNGADESQARVVAAVIRSLRPKIMLAPIGGDRHPDHQEAARLLHRALYLSNLINCRPAADVDVVYSAGDAAAADPSGNPGTMRIGVQKPWRTGLSAGYFIHGGGQPTITVDVTAGYTAKRQALAAYETQFAGPENTQISSPRFLAGLEDRDRYFGSLCGAEFAEGLVLSQPPVVRTLMNLLIEGKKIGWNAR